MIDGHSAKDLFGVPLVVARLDAQDLLDDLVLLWRRQSKEEPQDLEQDLDALRALFDPLRTGRTLRHAIASFEEALPETQSPFLQPPLIIHSPIEKIVTPEGRIVIEVLNEQVPGDASQYVTIPPNIVYAAEHVALTRYRQWSTRRLQSVLDLAAGSGTPLNIPSIGYLLLLLVNGSYSSATSLRRLSKSNDQERLDKSLGRIVASFSETLEPGNRDERHFSLYQGYALTEIRRRLPDALSDEPAVVYIRSDFRSQALRLVARELRRPKRSPATSRVLEAFDNLVITYRNELKVLASLGMAHEQRSATEQIRRELSERLDQASGID